MTSKKDARQNFLLNLRNRKRRFICGGKSASSPLNHQLIIVGTAGEIVHVAPPPALIQEMFASGVRPNVTSLQTAPDPQINTDDKTAPTNSLSRVLSEKAALQACVTARMGGVRQTRVDSEVPGRRTKTFRSWNCTCRFAVSFFNLSLVRVSHAPLQMNFCQQKPRGNEISEILV